MLARDARVDSEVQRHQMKVDRVVRLHRLPLVRELQYLGIEACG
jgi:hypothetical protein